MMTEIRAAVREYESARKALKAADRRVVALGRGGAPDPVVRDAERAQGELVTEWRNAERALLDQILMAGLDHRGKRVALAGGKLYAALAVGRGDVRLVVMDGFIDLDSMADDSA